MIASGKRGRKTRRFSSPCEPSINKVITRTHEKIAQQRTSSVHIFVTLCFTVSTLWKRSLCGALCRGPLPGCVLQEFAEARLYELWLKEKSLATRAEVGLVNTEEVGDSPCGGVLCFAIPASGRSDEMESR